MKLISLHIRRIPGIADPFRLTSLGSGLTVIAGPNGIGKTSICRAINALLWPDSWSASDGFCEVEAEWTGVGADSPAGWASCERIGSKTAWRDQSVTLDRPNLPGYGLASCFTIRIDEMLASQSPGSELAAEIAKQMAGGYDLNKALSAKWLNAPRPIAPLTALKEVEKQIGSLKNRHAKLRAEESRIAGLERKRDAARDAQKQLGALQNAAELAQARANLEQAQIEKSSLPESLRKIRAGDDALLKTLIERVDDLQMQRDSAQAAMESAAQRVSNCDLPGSLPIPAATLKDWDTWPSQLQQISSRCEQAKAAAGEARIKAEEAARRLAALGDVDLLAKIGDDALPRAQTLFERWMRLKSEEQVFERRLAHATSKGEAPEEPTALLAAQSALANLLALPDSRAPGVSRVYTLIALMLAALILIGGIAAGMLHQPLGWPLAALGAAICAVSLLERRANSTSIAESDTEAQRKLLRRAFEQSAVPPPAQWETEFVEARYREIGEEIAKALKERRFAEALQDQRRDIEADRPRLELERQRLEAERAALQACTTLNIEWPEIGNVFLLKNLIDYQNARIVWLAAQEVAESLAAARDEILERLNGQFELFGASPAHAAANHFSAKTIIDDFKERSSRLAQAMESGRASRAIVETTSQNLANCRAAIDEMLAERGLETTAEFDAVFTRWPRWVDLREQESLLISQIEGLAQRLAATPELAALSLPEVESLQAAAQAKADTAQSVTEEIAAINAAVGAAKTETALAAAYADKDKHIAEIAASRDKALFAVAGQFMLEQAREVDDKNQPEILQAASKLFTEVTRGAYTLKVRDSSAAAKNASGASFHAFDTAANSDCAFSTLSGGTRLQLLLCAKIAFAEHSAGGRHLPLFLDEVFKHSDPLRTAELIGCLKTLVADGRQIIYLTSDPADEMHFKKAFADNPASLACIDLAKARGDSRAWKEPIFFAPPTAAAAPLPGEAPADYGRRLGVPTIAAHRPLESLHLFYLLMDNADCLRRCLAGGVCTVGQWRALRDPHPARLLSEGESREIEAWCEVARIFLAEWRRGRGKPVSPDDLAAAELGPTYLPRVQEICRRVEGDAQRILDVIDGKDTVKVDRSESVSPAKRDALANFLADRGCIAAEPPATLDEIRLAAQNLPDRCLLAPAQIAARIEALYRCAEAG